MKIGRSIGTAIAVHNILKTGVHGVAANYIARSSLVTQLIAGADVDSTIKDPATATAGLRTLGTGAQQAAAGNHSHTLVEDIIGSGVSGLACANVGQGEIDISVPGESEVVLATTTNTFATLARAVAVGVACVSDEGGSVSLKLRLYMDNELMAESDTITYPGEPIVLIATKALAGVKTCELRVANSNAVAKILTAIGGSGTPNPCLVIGVASIEP